MSIIINKNKYILFTKVIFLVLFYWVVSAGFLASAQSLPSPIEENVSRVYVFLDSVHSFVQKEDSLVPTNYITVDSNFTKDIAINIFGSENFCKNIFYFSDNKIIFYNPSQYMTSYVWCQVQLTNKTTQKISNYKFILNRTFSSWCQEKETNLSIGKTIKAILNIFESNVCSGNIAPILADTRVLNLSGAHIDDISPITGFLKVRSLWLDNNEIENVGALGSMRNLVFLSLNNNFISNVKSLGEMEGLRWVFLNNNQIINIDFVQNLKTLKFLGINGNLVGDPTPLYNVSPSTSILANGNPFFKKQCNKNTKNLQTNKSYNSYFLKDCFENTTIKPAPVNSNVKLLSVPMNSKQHIATLKLSHQERRQP